MAKLTPLQNDFLAALFGPAAGSLAEAAKATGVSDISQLMTDEFAAAIKQRADNEMLWNVPKAIHVMKNMLENPSQVMNMEKLLKVCTEFLDRSGLSKQERGLSGQGAIGLVFLPNKAIVQEPIDETNEEVVPPTG